MNVGVLVSGSGTNLAALIAAQERGALAPARLAVVGANQPACQGLERAREAQIPTFLLDHRSFAGDRSAYDRALVAKLGEHRVELVVLAGFMRLLTPTFLQAFPGRIINIHPALLPAFPGVHAQKQAFEHGVKVTGCTVHFVDEGTDTGPIIAQAAVPVGPDDDLERLRLRILAEEHRLLPEAVVAIAEGRVQVEGRRVRVRPAP